MERATDKARILKLEEAIAYTRKAIWMELRETDGMIPVTYHSEHAPFLRFDAEDRVATIDVRGECYGITWRCWDRDPAGAQSVTDWKDE